MISQRISAKALRKPLPPIPRVLPRNVSRNILLALTGAHLVTERGKEVPLTQDMIQSILDQLEQRETKSR